PCLSVWGSRASAKRARIFRWNGGLKNHSRRFRGRTCAPGGLSGQVRSLNHTEKLQMFRRIIVAVLKLALRVYFRRIEVVGLENIPRDTAVIFVLNHPNALVDPVFLLFLAPRRVSFVAKAPLF